MVIIYIAPHLSTGGLPQYLYKKVELLSKIHKVYVVEYANITGGVLVVQRNKIKNLLNDHFLSLDEDKSELLKIINRLKPDIIHLEEIPELFMDSGITKQIYNPSRNYLLFETSHDSSYNVNNKVFFPDKFLLVSKYQIEQYKKLNIPCELVEYPIGLKQRTTSKSDCQEDMGWNRNKMHVVNVGLFTPRKNQAEIIEYAKVLKDYNVEFHFIGNQAENFKHYWEPLMKNLPSNCTWHGERDDVDNFYEAADLFLFTSRGTEHDQETMPLVIREAISWDIPSLIYNLPVYLNYFNSYPSISYLDFDNLEKNVNLIIEKLALKKLSNPKINSKDEISIISAYPTNSALEQLTLASVKAAKSAGLPVILCTHHAISPELQKECDYVIYDANNILVKHDFYSKSWYNGDKWYAEVNIKGEDNDVYHGPAVYTNYMNGLALAERIGYKWAHCHNFDMVLKPEVYQRFRNMREDNLGIFNINKSLEGNTLRTVYHYVNTGIRWEFPRISNGDDYHEWQKRVGSESNGLENIYYHNLRDLIAIDRITILDNETYYKQFEGSEIDVCSMVEYFTVLAVKNQPDKYAIWVSTSNKKDLRTIDIEVNYNERYENYYVDIRGVTQQYFIGDKGGSEYISFRNGVGGPIFKTIVITPNYDFEKNGFLEIK